jgi:hypothetical protein
MKLSLKEIEEALKLEKEIFDQIVKEKMSQSPGVSSKNSK